MKKRNTWRTVLSFILALSLCASLPLSVLAEEISGNVYVETTGGNSEPILVNITIQSTTLPDGSTQTEMTATGQNQVTDSGMIVDYSDQSNMNRDIDGTITGTGSSQYTVSNGEGTYSAAGGTEKEIKKQAPSTTVEVPLTDVDDPATAAKENQNTAAGAPVGTTNTTGDTPTGPDDGTYDYTTETVIQQGSATVTTTGISITDNTASEEDVKKEDLEFKVNGTDATDTNDLSDTPSKTDVETVGQSEVTPAEGYQFVYMGIDDTSQFWAAYLYTQPQVEGEKPVYVHKDDAGNVIQEYYIGRVGENGAVYQAPASYYIEGLYLDGQKVTDDSTGARWDSIHSFVMIDPATGKVTTTYCADHATPAVDGYSYNIENVEDATYYTDDQAAMIRTVALNGYWGTESGIGSLAAVKDMMRNATDDAGNRIFTDAEVDSLTDGVAMTATQYAIWTFSQENNDTVYLNTQFVPKDANNEYDLSLIGQYKNGTSGPRYSWSDFLKDVPADKQASVDLLFKLYNHMIHMDSSEIEDKTTANTIINADNFVDDLSVTVVKKAENHANNADSNKDNDAYVADLSFALVVAPSTENGDDLTVKVLDANGAVVASGRIAGQAKEGETVLTADANGNYTFSDIILTEGNQNFNITLEGIQNLEEGVYLYTSEIREEVSSQTMVGLAEGERAVSVSMNIEFDLNVEDEVVASEHVWRTEWNNGGGGQTFRIRRDGGGDDTVEIPDEEVPLADAPKTGDGSVILAVISALSGAGFAGISFTTRRKEQ